MLRRLQRKKRRSEAEKREKPKKFTQEQKESRKKSPCRVREPSQKFRGKTLQGNARRC